MSFVPTSRFRLPAAPLLFAVIAILARREAVAGATATAGATAGATVITDAAVEATAGAPVAETMGATALAGSTVAATAGASVPGPAPTPVVATTVPLADAPTDAAAADTADAEPETPQSTQQQIDDLQQRLKILERQKELEKEAATEKSKDTAQVGVGSDGFYVRSADGSFQFRFRGYLQFDGRFFEATENLPAQDTWLIRRLRPVFEGTMFKYFDYKIMPDIAGGTTTLVDGYIDARVLDALRIRGGKYKAPFGLERLQSARDLMFVERGLPVNLTPFRDTGVAVWGEPLGGVLSYMAGIFNGAPDGLSADTNLSHSMTVDARIFALPFKKSSGSAFKGLGFGYAATYGEMHGILGNTGLGTFKTAGQRTFFTYRVALTAAETTLADGLLVRLNPQAYYYYGRLGVQTEYISERQEVVFDTSRTTLRNSSWRFEVSFLLTDDTATFTGVDPKKPFAKNSHGPGAFEVAARVGELTVDDDAFPIFANPAVSANRAQEFALGLNWYLNRNVKVQINGSKTWFDGGSPTGDRDDENVLETCFQIAF